MLYGDPTAVPLTAHMTGSGPVLPTPADLLARESIRGVFGARRRPGALTDSADRLKLPPAPATLPPVRKVRGSSVVIWVSVAVIAVALAVIVVTLVGK